MTPDARGELALGAALTFIAGWVDAGGFLRLDHLFVSFMSGNSTKFAVALMQAQWATAARFGGAVVLFVVGTVLGRMVRRRAGAYGRTGVLACVAVLLVVSVVAAQRQRLGAGGLLLAMGMQNDAAMKLDGETVGTTYVTGTLVSLGRAVADALCGETSDWPRLLLLWTSLTVGGLTGAAAYLGLGLVSLLAPALAAALLGARLGGLVRRARTERPR